MWPSALVEPESPRRASDTQSLSSRESLEPSVFEGEAGLRRDAVRSQFIDVLEAQIKGDRQ